MGLWLFAVCYAREQETDGFVPEAIIHAAWGGRSNAKLANRLVAAGLIERVTGGYSVCKYAEKNETKADITARREEQRERQQRSRGERVTTRKPPLSRVTPITVTRDNCVTHVAESESESESEPEPEPEPEERERARAPEGDPWPLTPASYAAPVFAAVGMASGVVLDDHEIPAMWAQFVGHLAADSENPGARTRPATRAEWQRWVTREARRKQELSAKARDRPAFINPKAALIQPHDPNAPWMAAWPKDPAE
jgi:hypothetical protein